MAVLSFFIPKLNFIQTPIWPVLYVYHCVTGSPVHKPNSPIIEAFNNTGTDRQYSCYAKNLKGCLSNEIICVDLRFSSVFQNTHMKKIFSTLTGKQYRI